MRISPVCLLLLIAACGMAVEAPAARPDGRLELSIVDAANSQPIAARMILRDPRGRPVRQRGLGSAAHGDHFYIDGQAVLELRRGQYTFTLDAGPEFHPQSGHFEIERRADDAKQVAMRRAVDLQAEGWIGADLDAPRPGDGFGAALRGERLGFAARVITTHTRGGWEPTDRRPAKQPRTPETQGGAAWRSVGGPLLFYPRNESQLPTADDPLTGQRLGELRLDGCRVVAADLTAWRLPIWVAYDALDAAMVIDAASLADRPPRKPLGLPRDEALYPGARGVGRWREAIYFHLLNAGVALPPVAGSGSGVTDAPLGSARVYASVDDAASPDSWWDAVKAGATFVTTGPLLRPSVDGRRPGHTFFLDSGSSTEFQVALSLTTRDPIEYLELIKNGVVEQTVSLRTVAKQGGRLPPLSFDGSGWFTVRAATTLGPAYHRAMSAPYFVSAGNTPRISAKSCRFFLDWLTRLEGHATPEELAHARAFWSAQLAKAKAP